MGFSVLVLLRPTWGGVVAWGKPCAYDRGDRNRPIAGIVNIGPAAYRANKAWLNSSLIHEVVHAIGFSTLNSPVPIYSETVTQGRNAPHIRRFLNSTAILREARKHFSCDRYFGAEIEEASMGLHWASRLFGDEIMTAAALGQVPSKLSSLTLAFFDDSGWYQVDYSRAENITWGKGKGCNFANAQPCTADLEYACPADGSALVSPGNLWSKCYSNRFRSVCTTQKSSSTQPPEYQYPGVFPAGFSGFDIYDYCPLAVPGNGVSYDCAVADPAAPGDFQDFLTNTGQSYAKGTGMCHEGTIEAAGKTPVAMCHDTRCTREDVWVLAGNWQKCDQRSNMMTFKPPSTTPAALANYFRCPTRTEARCPPSLSLYPKIDSFAFKWTNSDRDLILTVTGSGLDPAAADSLSVVVCKAAPPVHDARGNLIPASTLAKLPCASVEATGANMTNLVCKISPSVATGFRYEALFTVAYTDTLGRSAISACGKSGMGDNMIRIVIMYLFFAILIGGGLAACIYYYVLRRYPIKFRLREIFSRLRRPGGNNGFSRIGDEDGLEMQADPRVSARSAALAAAEARAAEALRLQREQQRNAEALRANPSPQQQMLLEEGDAGGTIVALPTAAQCEACGAQIDILPSAQRAHREVCPGQKKT